MLPVIQAFMAAHRLPAVTVVADAGMVSEANQKPIEARALADLKFSEALPEPLATATLAARLADLDSALLVLGETARFIIMGG